MTNARTALAAAILSASAACGGQDDTIDGLTPEEWALVAELSPLPPVPPSPTNAYADDPAAATLGQALFFEKRLAGPLTFEATPEEGGLGGIGEIQKVNCASCHDAQAWFVDTRSNPPATSLGAGGWLSRHTITLVNCVYYEWSGWTGFIDTYWGHSILGIESSRAANGDRLRTAHIMWDYYRDEYNAVFDPDLDPALDAAAPDASRFPPSGRPKAMPSDPDGPWEMMTPEDQAFVTGLLVNSGKAMEAYIRLLRSGDAPFDRYVAGDRSAISDSAKRGLKLFIGKAACLECHKGPHFEDSKFHNLGVPQEGEHVATEDTGRKSGIERILGALSIWSSASPYSDDTSGTAAAHLDGLMATDAELGKFRTPSLRNVEMTPPYMHTGQFETLLEVVQFYNEGGGTTGFMGVKDELIQPLNLTDAEMNDLVEFLRTLTGAPIPATLTADTSVPL